MTARGAPQTKKVLITVKTYPTPSWSSIESCCTAGITDQNEWIRLYPIPFRLLESAKQFSKYQWVELSAVKSSSDRRPESYRVDPESIKVVGAAVDRRNKWIARKRLLDPLISQSLCELKRAQQVDRRSLGLFKPKNILGLDIERDPNPDWSEAERAKLMQDNMFLQRPASILEKIPYKFYYRFTCEDPKCTTLHRISCYDWEIHQSYRDWRRRWPRDWEEKLRWRYEHEMIELNDTHFFMGTMAAHPDTWIIVGLYYPRK